MCRLTRCVRHLAASRAIYQPTVIASMLGSVRCEPIEPLRARLIRSASPLTRERDLRPTGGAKNCACALKMRQILKIDPAPQDPAPDCSNRPPTPKRAVALFRAVPARTVRSIVSLPWTVMSLARNGSPGGTGSTKGTQQS
jgi:hypothetical protein